MKMQFVEARIFRCADGRYGIEASCGEGNVRIYDSISGDFEELERFVCLINSREVSSLHIDEIIEDYLM